MVSGSSHGWSAGAAYATGPVGRGPRRRLTKAQPGWVTVKWYGGGEPGVGDRLTLQTLGSEDLRVSCPRGSVLVPFWVRSEAGETQPLELEGVFQKAKNLLQAFCSGQF